MAQFEEKCNPAAARMDAVVMYLTTRRDTKEFIKLYNKGILNYALLKTTGHITEEEVERWLGICLDALGSTEDKKAVSDAAYIESLHRFISTLENKINYLDELLKYERERLKALLEIHKTKDKHREDST